MKITTIVGARPQFIKAAAVSRAIKKYNSTRNSQAETLDELIVHTGQHYDYNMSRVFFEELEIPEPDINLGIGSGTHGAMTGAMLAAIEKTLEERTTDCLLVYGDTNSTLAGALAAAKLNIPVAHVEAGLRSHNRKMPEEINRLVTDHLSALLFCPTDAAVANLMREGIENGVMIVGDVMYDSVLYYKDRAKQPNIDRPYGLATLHRAENTDDRIRLSNILTAMAKAPVPIVLPLHPRTRKTIARLQLELSNNISAIEPVSYLSLLGYLEKCEFVITDSGGLQKEAYFFQKKCITVRDETEWIELVETDANKVVTADKRKIVDAYAWAAMPITKFNHLYGLGDASERIVKAIFFH